MRHFFFMIGLVPTVASAATVDVCGTCDITTIGQGIAEAGSGGTVLVHAGSYQESVIITNDVRIRSIGGSGATHWEGDGQSVVTITDGANVQVIGFTLAPNSGGSLTEIVGVSLPDAARAVLVDVATVELDDIVVSRFNSTLDGVALYAVASTVTVTSSRFESIETSGEAPGVYSMWSTIDIDYSLFTDLGGSAIYGRESNINVRGSVFTGNGQILRGDGGSIHLAGGYLVVADSRFSDGRADNGGDIWLAPNTLSELAYNSYIGGEAESGGSVFVEQSLLTIQGGRWESNQSEEEGGAVTQVGRGDATVTDAVFVSNSSGDGGAWYMDSDGSSRPALSVYGTLWLNNTATTGGGIGSSHTEVLTVSDSIFVGNQAADGGATRVDVHTSILIENSLFCSNKATRHGGAFYLDSTDEVGTVRGSVFALNTANANGGAFWITDTAFDGDQNTFVDNFSLAEGHAVYSEGIDFTLRRSIVSWTRTLNTEQIYGEGFSTVISEQNLWWPSLDDGYGGDIRPPGSASGD
ncbi:MAG: putative outer membrane repeat protein, partial [Myxococcota bacterium]